MKFPSLRRGDIPASVLRCLDCGRYLDSKVGDTRKERDFWVLCQECAYKRNQRLVRDTQFERDYWQSLGVW